jgi:hypothetical protein
MVGLCQKQQATTESVAPQSAGRMNWFSKNSGGSVSFGYSFGDSGKSAVTGFGDLWEEPRRWDRGSGLFFEI